MQPEWNKLNLGPVVSDLSSDLQVQLDALKKQLEEETRKIQNLADIFAVELQKILDNNLNQ